MIQRTVPIIENVPIAERTFRVRLHAPEIARTIRPGQFLMLKLPGTSDPLLGRPFAMFDIAEDAIDVVYLVVGKMTGLLANMQRGESIDIWGPLGNGFRDYPNAASVTLIAGGIGQTPFMAYARQLFATGVKNVRLYYGIRTAALAAGVADFENAGVQVHLASDDGSVGHRGFVTDLLDRDQPPGPWVACGPEPMLHAVRQRALARGVKCDISLETPMACGFGICFSCVAKVKTADGWDYKRVCVDGPVFDAADLCSE